jgi:hypothetical protein
MADLHTPSPDAGHEAIRAPLADAVDRLDDHVSRLDDAFLLAQVTADFAQSTLDSITAMQEAGKQMQAALADLTSRVAALEAASPTPDPPAAA